jgi:hypothetical protein
VGGVIDRILQIQPGAADKPARFLQDAGPARGIERRVIDVADQAGQQFGFRHAAAMPTSKSFSGRFGGVFQKARLRFEQTEGAAASSRRITSRYGNIYKLQPMVLNGRRSAQCEPTTGGAPLRFVPLWLLCMGLFSIFLLSGPR